MTTKRELEESLKLTDTGKAFLDTVEEKYTTLDTEQCKWWVNTLFSMAKEKACNSHNFDDAEEMQAAQDKIIKALEQNEELQKENEDFQNYIDKANHTNSQLIQLIEKHKMNRSTSDDCVSRQAVLDKKELIELPDGQSFYSVDPEDIKDLPSVTLTHGTCKECRYCGAYSCGYSCYKGHWGKISKESNYGGMGDFYCADFEKRGNKND